MFSEVVELEKFQTSEMSWPSMSLILAPFSIGLHIWFCVSS